MAVTARYFDGRSARAQAVKLEARPGALVLLDADGAALARWPMGEITIKGDPAIEPVIRLAARSDPEARLELSGPPAVAFARKLLPALRKEPRRGARLWLPLAAGAAAIVAIVVLAVDRLPGLLAPLVPYRVQAALGDAVLAQFGGKDLLCDNPEGVAALADLARRLSAAGGMAEPAQVQVIRLPEANAFAAPGARIAILDGLIQKAEGPDEVAGVLAHEMGHAIHHHAMRGILRQLGVSTAMTFVLGGSGVGDIGQTLMTLSYSRAAEAEADATALELLDRAGLRSDGLNRMLGRLSEEGDATAVVPAWLLTHPPTADRLAATVRPATGEPALSPEQWAALRGICGRHSGSDGKRSKPEAT